MLCNCRLILLVIYIASTDSIVTSLIKIYLQKCVPCSEYTFFLTIKYHFINIWSRKMKCVLKKRDIRVTGERVVKIFKILSRPERWSASRHYRYAKHTANTLDFLNSFITRFCGLKPCRESSRRRFSSCRIYYPLESTANSALTKRRSDGKLALHSQMSANNYKVTSQKTLLKFASADLKTTAASREKSIGSNRRKQRYGKVSNSENEWIRAYSTRPWSFGGTKTGFYPPITVIDHQKSIIGRTATNSLNVKESVVCRILMEPEARVANKV